jgi:hypothetical protein
MDVAWTLQNPSQLQLEQLPIVSGEADNGKFLPTAARLWEQSSECLSLMGYLLVDEQMSRQATCKAETLAAAMLQQLEQSGKRHS